MSLGLSASLTIGKAVFRAFQDVKSRAKAAKWLDDESKNSEVSKFFNDCDLHLENYDKREGASFTKQEEAFLTDMLQVLSHMVNRLDKFKGKGRMKKFAAGKSYKKEIVESMARVNRLLGHLQMATISKVKDMGIESAKEKEIEKEIKYPGWFPEAIQLWVHMGDAGEVNWSDARVSIQKHLLELLKNRDLLDSEMFIISGACKLALMKTFGQDRGQWHTKIDGWMKELVSAIDTHDATKLSKIEFESIAVAPKADDGATFASCILMAVGESIINPREDDDEEAEGGGSSGGGGGGAPKDVVVELSSDAKADLQRFMQLVRERQAKVEELEKLMQVPVLDALDQWGSSIDAKDAANTKLNETERLILDLTEKQKSLGSKAGADAGQVKAIEGQLGRWEVQVKNRKKREKELKKLKKQQEEDGSDFSDEDYLEEVEEEVEDYNEKIDKIEAKMRKLGWTGEDWDPSQAQAGVSVTKEELELITTTLKEQNIKKLDYKEKVDKADTNISKGQMAYESAKVAGGAVGEGSLEIKEDLKKMELEIEELKVKCGGAPRAKIVGGGNPEPVIGRGSCGNDLAILHMLETLSEKVDDVGKAVEDVPQQLENATKEIKENAKEAAKKTAKELTRNRDKMKRTMEDQTAILEAIQDKLDAQPS